MRGQGGSGERAQQGREQAGGGAGEDGDGGRASQAEATEADGWQGGADLLAGTARGAARERARRKAVQPSRELLALALAEAGVAGEQAGAGMQAAGGTDSDAAARTVADEGVRRAAPPAGAAARAAAAAPAARVRGMQVDVEAAVAAAGELRLDPPSHDASAGHAHGGDGGRRHADRQRGAVREKRAPGGKRKHRTTISLRLKRVICMLRAARPDMPARDILRLVQHAFDAAARHPQATPTTTLPTCATAAAAGRAASLAAGEVAAGGVEAAGVAALDVAAVRRILRKSRVYLALPAHGATLIRHSSGAHPQVQAAVAAWVRAMEARYGREALQWGDIVEYARQVGPHMGVGEGFRYSRHWARKALLRHGLGSNWGKQVERGSGKKKGTERGDGGELSIAGRTTDGNTTDGNTTDGNTTDGNTTDGNTTEDQSSDGGGTDEEREEGRCSLHSDRPAATAAATAAAAAAAAGLGGRAAGGEQQQQQQQQQEGPVERLQRLAEQWAAEPTGGTPGRAHGRTGEGADGRQRRWRHTVVPPAVKLAMCALARALPSLPSTAIARAVGARCVLLLASTTRFSFTLTHATSSLSPSFVHPACNWSTQRFLSRVFCPFSLILLLLVPSTFSCLPLSTPFSLSLHAPHLPSLWVPLPLAWRGMAWHGRYGMRLTNVWLPAVLLREDHWRQLAQLSRAGRPGAIRLRAAETRLEEALALAVRKAIARMEEDRRAAGGGGGGEVGSRGGPGAAQQQECVRAVQEYARRLAPLVGVGRRFKCSLAWVQQLMQRWGFLPPGGAGRAGGGARGRGGRLGGEEGEESEGQGGVRVRIRGILDERCEVKEEEVAALVALVEEQRERRAQIKASGRRLTDVREEEWIEEGRHDGGEASGGIGSSREEWESKEGIVSMVAGRSAGGGMAGGRGRKRRRSGDAQDGAVAHACDGIPAPSHHGDAQDKVVASRAGAAAAGSGAAMAGRRAAGGGRLAAGGQLSAGMAAPLLAPELIVAAALRAALRPHPVPAPFTAHAPRFPFPQAVPPATTALHSLAQLLASDGLLSALLPVIRP
ncbi:unnamed protein product [Closterium sp. Yama58-4]|nr:unnamed protein product [Closterium sp. Yama58-4]